MHALLFSLFLKCVKCVLLLEKTFGCGKAGQQFVPLDGTLYQLTFCVAFYVNIITGVVHSNTCQEELCISAELTLKLVFKVVFSRKIRK